MPTSRDQLLNIERRYTGPIPAEARWMLRLGGRAAYERARAKAAIRYLSEKCARLIRLSKPPTPGLHDEVRRMLAERARWRGR